MELSEQCKQHLPAPVLGGREMQEPWQQGLVHGEPYEMDIAQVGGKNVLTSIIYNSKHPGGSLGSHWDGDGVV